MKAGIGDAKGLVTHIRHAEDGKEGLTMVNQMHKNKSLKR